MMAGIMRLMRRCSWRVMILLMLLMLLLLQMLLELLLLLLVLMVLINRSHDNKIRVTFLQEPV